VVSGHSPQPMTVWKMILEPAQVVLHEVLPLGAAVLSGMTFVELESLELDLGRMVLDPFGPIMLIRTASSNGALVEQCILESGGLRPSSTSSSLLNGRIQSQVNRGC
jgi:hypothetical protein